ncbi:MAG: 30S ribosomal protein S17 [Sinobacteraceae bacterium]|nr:30S ribosomal protein S17 [Nevskiaceae bacterium]
MSEPTSPTTKTQRRMIGRVVSDKMNQTVTVAIDRTVVHPVYGKRLRRTTKLHAHNENNLARAGDLVAVVETRPLSRTKHHRVVEVLERAAAPAAEV